MNGINKVVLVGTLGNDPDVKNIANNNIIARLSIATSENWKDKNTGEKVSNTEWHRVIIFGRLAEIAGQYLKKGSRVYIEGKLKTSKYQDKNTGEDKYSTDIVVDIKGSMQLLDRAGTNPQQAQTPTNQKAQQPQPHQQAFKKDGVSSDDVFNDDIPF